MEKIKTFFGKNAEVEQTDEYVIIKVTYEVIENIGMQEKIEEVEQQKDKTQ